MNVIEAHNITRTFYDGPVVTEVLKGIDITIKQGEFVAIMGKSGAGKSTLMYQVSLLDTPNTGTLTVQGTNVLELSESEQTSFRLKTLGYVFQNYALVPDLSAEENVMLPLLMRGHTRGEARDLARTALNGVDLSDRYRNLPAELSGGQQQRVSIARAIAGTPSILFADEPTANLDSVSGTQVVSLLKDLHDQGQTVVMVTHEAEYARGCDRIIEMSDGVITDIKTAQ
jgi:putative ABC transport system ATP-binding protein